MCEVNQSVNATAETPTETYEYNGADMVWVSISTCLVFIMVRIFLNNYLWYYTCILKKIFFFIDSRNWVLLWGHNPQKKLINKPFIVGPWTGCGFSALVHMGLFIKLF